MRALSVSLTLLACAAFAQTAAVDSDDLSRGTTLLPGSSAWSDEATSLIYNPAGLTFSGRANAWYVHERSNSRGQNNDSVFLSTSLFDTVGLGAGVEWLRPVEGVARTRGLLGLSVGTEKLSAGATLSFFRGAPINGLTSLDVGVQSKPLRWLAVGAQVRNLNTPGNATTALGREWILGVGLRPLNERVSLGVDWVIPESTPLATSRLQYTVSATLVRGLRVMAGVSHGFTAAQPLFFQAGLGVDLEHFGYAQGISFSESNVNWQFAARLSLDAYGSIVPSKKIAVVSLSGLAGSTGNTVGSLLGVATENRFLSFLKLLEGAANDPELAAVVVKVEGSGVGLARADELRAAIVRLREAGKKVYAYVLSGDDMEYLAISACDGIYAAPEAMLQIDGLRSSVMYFGGAAKMLGVTVEVARVGKYKNFPDQFTRFDMSAEQKETINAYLDTSTKIVAQRVEAGRKLAPAAWKAVIDEGLKPTRREKQLGTIDGVVTPQQFDDVLREKLPDARLQVGYSPFPDREQRWGAPKRIAIIPVLGQITGGKNGMSLLGESSGAETFIAAITQATNDPDVAAIVVRVDSGGGDGLASDLMYRAVLEAKKHKPVIASMGDLAASGGYYVAMGADEIWASPTTLTGSIGVFFTKPAIHDLAEKLGVTEVTISRGKLSGLTDSFNPWSDDERAAAQRWVDDFYDTFITEAAASRKVSKEAIDAVARGRVWSGEDAQRHHLVDQLGGLMDAVASAKKHAQVETDDVRLEVVKSGSGVLGSLLGATAPSALLQATLPQTALPPALEALAQKLGPAAWLLETGAGAHVQARMEWLVDVR
jgi:protease IV